MKIRPVGAELFHAGEGADMTQITVAFRNIANAPKNSVLNSERTQDAPYYEKQPVCTVQTISPCLLYHIKHINALSGQTPVLIVTASGT